MIDGLKPYPAYKDSGASWLGEVPAHWDVLPSRALFTESRERGHVKEQMLSVTIASGVIAQSDLLRDTSKKDSSNEDRTSYQLVRPGDIAYNKMRAWQGAIGVSGHRGIVSPAYVVMTPREGNDGRYFHYLLRTPAFAKEAERWSYGITSDQWNLRPEHFKMIYCTRPPAAEQETIVRFIDHADRCIRHYIRAKQKLIALLEEQQQTIVHRAITRGLDPKVRLKPSGVQWLGDVPEHWVLKRFKYVARVSSGQIDPRQEPFVNYVLIAPNHIESGTGRLRLEETAGAQGADSGKYRVREGEIVYSKIRPNLRKSTIAPRDCLCSADMYPIRPDLDELRAPYLLRLMLSKPFTQYVVDCSMRVAMPKVNREALGNCVLWYPPLEEQDAILAAISAETAPVAAVISSAQRDIALVRELRTRLISDVVTGKVDVRAAAAHLPREMDGADRVADADVLAEDYDDAEQPDPDAALAEAEV